MSDKTETVGYREKIMLQRNHRANQERTGRRHDFTKGSKLYGK